MKNSNCRFYGSRHGCNKGNQCKFSHSNPNSVTFCKDLKINGKCRFGTDCKYRHCDYELDQKHQIKQSKPVQNNIQNKRKEKILLKSSNYDLSYLIVSSYIHSCAININKCINIIPLEIVELCLKYYFKKNQYLLTWYISKTKNRYEQYILYDIQGLDTNNKADFMAKTSTFKTNAFIKKFKLTNYNEYGSETWISSGIFKQDLPQWVFKKHIYRKMNELTEYRYIIRLFRYNSLQYIGIYLHDIENFDKGTYLLETIPKYQTNKILGATYASEGIIAGVFDTKYQQFIAMGGSNGSNIFALEMNDKKWYKFNHIQLFGNENKYYGKNGSCMCIVQDYNNSRILFCLGGKYYGIHGYNHFNQITEYCFLDNQLSSTATMKCKLNEIRINSGVDVQNDNIIVIGGGYDYDKSNTQIQTSQYSIEYLDLNKPNAWILYSYKMNYPHRYKPCIWTDWNNKNIMYIASCEQSNIEWIDWRIGGKWNVFNISNRKIYSDHFVQPGSLMWYSKKDLTKLFCIA